MRQLLSPKMQLLLRISAVVLLIAYPFLVFFGLQHVSARHLGGVLFLAILLRWLFDRPRDLNWFLPFFAGALLAFAIVWLDDKQWLKWYPVVISGGFLVVFATSLRFPPTMIERIARALDGELSARDIRYTRIITQIWCGFFLLNISIATLSVFGSETFWLMYNGLISYVLMGILLFGERLGRQRFKAMVNA